MTKKGKRTDRFEPQPETEQLAKQRSADVPDPEKKSTGHGKKTADKWNQ